MAPDTARAAVEEGGGHLGCEPVGPMSYIVRTGDRGGLDEVTARLAGLGVVPAARWNSAPWLPVRLATV